MTAFAPGRVNLVGEHTDYNQGLALPFAIREGVTVTATPLEGRTIEVTALDFDEHDSFEIDRPQPVDGWRAFVRGVVGELSAAGVPLRGARLGITGSVPRGGGLSSSAALEVATVLALLAQADASGLDRIDLAKLCARAENEWGGAQTGLLDQLASLYGVEGHALRIDFRTLEVSPVPLELAGHQLVMLDSGDHHSNAASGYNERRAECTRACELLDVDSLRDATVEHAAQLPEPLGRRARHVIADNERVEQAVDALQRRDFERLGDLLDAAHASLRDDYEVSTPAVEAAVSRLKRSGALGARIIGGGFGGHVLGLFAPDAQVPDGSVQVRSGTGAAVVSERSGRPVSG